MIMRLLLLLLFSFSPLLHAKTLLIIGDSLSAGYGIELDAGWANLLQQRLNEHESEATEYTVINASISGNTTSMGVGRTPGLLKKHSPDIVVIQLGGNDGLQGHPVKVMEKNLSKMIEYSQQAGAKVLLVGIQIPPNYGTRYTDQFFATFPKIAEHYEVPVVPFMLDDVATNPELMQRDGVHPKAEAQPQLLDNIWPYLEPLL